jgi:hypothetical protein
MLHIAHKLPYEQIEEEVYSQLSENIYQETNVSPLVNMLDMRLQNTDEILDTIHNGDHLKSGSTVSVNLSYFKH